MTAESHEDRQLRAAVESVRAGLAKEMRRLDVEIEQLRREHRDLEGRMAGIEKLLRRAARGLPPEDDGRTQ